MIKLKKHTALSIIEDFIQRIETQRVDVLQISMTQDIFDSLCHEFEIIEDAYPEKIKYERGLENPVTNKTVYGIPINIIEDDKYKTLSISWDKRALCNGKSTRNDIFIK